LPSRSSQNNGVWAARHKEEGIDVRTAQETKISGLYVSDCCEVEQIFAADETAWRCPKCHRLCDWELVKIVFSPQGLEEVGVATR
jgi:hypothetical protein